MTELLIAPDELPAWLPGTLTVRSPEQGWDGVAVRGYRYGASDVEVPPLRDHVVVAYRRGTTPMRRSVDGTWTAEHAPPRRRLAAHPGRRVALGVAGRHRGGARLPDRRRAGDDVP